MKKNKKIAIALILILSLFSPFSTFAYIVDLGKYIGKPDIDVNEIMQEANSTGISNITDLGSQSTEQRYGINENVWRSAERKESAPKVELFFDNTNPKPGEKVTAHAVPEFFKNDPQDLYYTWYLIHKSDAGDDDAIKKGKIEASKIMARGDYDPELDGQTYQNANDDKDNDGWPSVDKNSYDPDTTAAPMGGSDGVGGLTQETVSSFNTSTEWCDSLGDHRWSDCRYNDSDAFKPLNTYFTLNSSQTNHYCSLCTDYFSGDGAAAYTSAKSARNNCCYQAIPESSLQCSETSGDPPETTYYKCDYNSNTDYCGVTYNSSFESCYDTFESANKSIVSTCLNNEYDSCKTDWATTHEDLNGDGFSDYSGQATVGVSRCYRHNFGTSNTTSVFRENELSDSATADSSGLDYPVSCKHKWENAKKPNCTADDCKSGSGKFPEGEEKYWGTDPTDPDTDGDGVKDEGDVIGLNQDSFTWNYQAGDRVGVVIEGTSMIPTDEMSAYYKIMWGYLDVCDSTKAGLMKNDECDGSEDYGFGFLATQSPSEQGDDRLQVSLTYTPDNPIADPSDANSDNILSDGTITDADRISVVSSLDNTDYNPNNLYYLWQIQKGDPQSDDWGKALDISDNFSTTTPSSGMGLSSFSFAPKKDVLTDGLNYFKVTLTASKASQLDKGQGRSSVIIAVNTKGVKISLYKVNIVDGKAAIGDEICNDGLYKTLCPVVKGQMVAAKATLTGKNLKTNDHEFAWKVSGNSVYEPANVSQLFSGWTSDSTIFFPITKEEQDVEDVSVTSTSQDELQPTVGTRLMTVVHPAVFIRSADTSLSWPKTYVAEDPNLKSTLQNYQSSDAFSALAGSTAQYYLDFVPYYLIGEDANSQINWSVNGTDITNTDFYENNPFLGLISLDNNDRQINLPISDTVGAFATLSAEVKKYWSEDERSIPYTAWGIAPDTLSGNTSVSIEAVSSASDDAVGSANTPGQILAAIGTHLPHYFMYLLRLALTMAVMFIASVGLYGFSQKLNIFGEED
jgi:hypothetical protein